MGEKKGQLYKRGKVSGELSIVIPAYNEGEIIGSTIKSILNQMKNWDIEIVVVSDGSTDNTKQEVIGVLWSGNIRFIEYSENKGKGYAVRRGILACTHPHILILDADLSINPFELNKMDYSHYTDTYIVKGQRYQVVKQPLHRIIVGKAWKVLVWMITGIYMDTQSPFTFMHLPKEFYKDLKIDGFAFDVEILYRAKQQNIPVYTCPVAYHNDPNSSVKFKHTIQMFTDLLKIRFSK